jgi:predicted nucleotidyltransferase
MTFQDHFAQQELDALEELLRILAGLGLPEPMVVGAVAIRTRVPPDARLMASREPDLAIALPSSEALERVYSAVVPSFEVSRVGVRLVHQLTRVPFDLVPFGDVETEPGVVVVNGRTLNVLAFREAWTHAQVVEVGACRIRIPTAAFLVVLKLASWSDRGAGKDIADVERLLRALPDPGDAPWSDALLMDHMAARRTHLGDLPVWSAMRELRRHLRPDALARVRTIVDRLAGADFHVRAEMRELVGPGTDDPDEQDELVLHQLAVLALALAD